MQSEYQDELFEEFKKRENPLRQMTKKILPKRKPHIIYISLEQAISLGIFVIFGFIITFALGVEKGKRQIKPMLKDEETIISQQEIVPPVTTTPTKIEKPYTIQLISYKDKRKAEAKTKELEARGLKTYIIEQSNWYQVCVGSYSDKKEALNDLKKFSQGYKGSFLRRR